MSRSLPQQVIHYDANDFNLLIDVDAAGHPRLVGVIDFGDAAKGFRVADLAIACAYGMLGKSDPVDAVCAIVSGFHEQTPLLEIEADALIHLIVTRLCTSVAISSRRGALNPDDEYAQVSAVPAWEMLDRLSSSSIDFARYRIRDVAGFDPSPKSLLAVEWLSENAQDCHQVCNADLKNERLTVLDLTPGSSDPVILQPERAATAMIEDRIAADRSVAAIGRYDEARLAYTDDRFEIETWSGKQNRTIHLGVDVFFQSGSPVYAVLDGEVSSVVSEVGDQGYGTVVILRHEPLEGVCFYTLYGHLAREVADRLSPGDKLDSGELVGRLGTPEENGGWTPHLHFQVLTDLLDWTSSFPGVAPAHERSTWTSICPDPNIILGIPEAALTDDHLARNEIAEARSKVIGPSLGLSYAEPLHLVRGIGTSLFDGTGRRYLDCVNNVCHVGHGHPEVVRAVAEQMRILNTNTRYLHENLVLYAQKLTQTLPESLDTCFFVNSGSEANDLAIRMARTFTGREATVVIDGAYHGHLSSLIRLSPYKFDGPGGSGRQSGVFVTALPDSYRGLYSGDNAARLYAADVERCLNEAEAVGGAAAFIFESMLSCGGQIDPPPDYLREACAHASDRGAVCIADEVQVGFGRIGKTFWAFERQEVVPDIVTMGKPMGNGFPLGAVVTTREIAEAFDNGMEYFNSFGGSPVACAAGLAVLGVIEQEGLQANADRVGSRLKAGLMELAARHPLIGDVRGAGLFIGIELVTDRDERSPASVHAGYLVDRARQRGVLLSADGRDRNVLKIKPPLVFSDADADRLIEELSIILNDTFLQIR